MPKIFCGDKRNQGGGVAAPIASQVLGEVLPYLEVTKDNNNEDNTVNKVVVPNVEGLTLKEAKQQINDANLNIQYNGDEGTENDDLVITEQIPIDGVEVLEQSTIMVK